MTVASIFLTRPRGTAAEFKPCGCRDAVLALSIYSDESLQAPLWL